MARASRVPVRPVFFDVTRIQLPVGALTSIAHRISGVLLAVGLPIAMYLLHLSLRDEQGFAEVARWADAWVFKVPALLFAWALAHHILAGVRHLLTDVSVGSTLFTARRSAWAVNLCGVAIALLVGALWL